MPMNNHFSIFACYTLVVVCLVCSVIRWFHMCRPYDQNEKYFYPCRKMVSLMFATTVILLIYVFRPDVPAAWTLARCFMALLLPAEGILMFRAFYFRKPKILELVAVSLGAELAVALSVCALLPVSLSVTVLDLLHWASILVSLLLMACLINVTTWLMKQIYHTLHCEYSNEDDFPLGFAKLTVMLPGLLSVAAFALEVFGNPLSFGILCIILAINAIAFTLTILHPQRKLSGAIDTIETKPLSKESAAADGGLNSGLDNALGNALNAGLDDAPAEAMIAGTALIAEDTAGPSCTLPPEMLDELEAKVRRIFQEDKIFLNPNLNKNELVSLLGTNRTYLTIVFRERFESFYAYVNRLRLEYANEYSRTHPDATRQEVAANSGFGSPRTYSRVLKQYGGGRQA